MNALKIVALLLALTLPFLGLGDGDHKTLVNLPESGPLSEQMVYTDSYAIFIGIAKFQNPSIPVIPCAVNDAKTMRDILVKKYGFNPDKNHLILLANEQATRSNIIEAIAKLCDRRRIKVTDRVLVYFSCHGQEVPNPNGGGKGYIIPYDADIDFEDVSNPPLYQTSCIEMESIGAALESCPARHRSLIVDACFSGFALGSKGIGDGINLTDQTMGRLLSEPGLSIMTAGTRQDKARGDGSETGLSAFTRALRDTLTTGEIGGGTFSVSQLYAAAKERTTNATKGSQVPGFGMRDGTGEMLFFPLGTRPPNGPFRPGTGQVTDIKTDLPHGNDGQDRPDKESLKRQLAVVVDCVGDQTSGDSVESALRSALLNKGFQILGPEMSRLADKARKTASENESSAAGGDFKKCLVLKGTLMATTESISPSGIALKKVTLRLPLSLYDGRGNFISELRGGQSGEPAIGTGANEVSAMDSAIALLAKAIAIEFVTKLKSLPSPWNP